MKLTKGKVIVMFIFLLAIIVFLGILLCFSGNGFVEQDVPVGNGVEEPINGEELIEGCDYDSVHLEVGESVCSDDKVFKLTCVADYEIDKYDCDALDRVCKDGECVKEECAGEGEFTSMTYPDFISCCEGLVGGQILKDGRPLVGGGLLCYEPKKVIPECMWEGTRSEGWYYPAWGGGCEIENGREICYTQSPPDLLTYANCEGLEIDFLVIPE